MTPSGGAGAPLSGRDISRQRRAALSTQGRGAVKALPNGTQHAPANRSTEATSFSEPPAVAPTTTQCERTCCGQSTQEVDTIVRQLSTQANGATVRQLAMQRRMITSLNGTAGRPGAAQSRPSGRTRPAVPDLPALLGHTLAGLPVTGTQLERSTKVTGIEAGTCRHISGTEYIGAEQYTAWCDSRPAARPPKVAQSTSLSGQRVTGTIPSSTTRVTGDERGTCRALTGSQYLGGDHFEAVCGVTPPAPGPGKTAMSTTALGRTVSGSVTGVGAGLTGNESGLCRAVTGSQYLAAEDLAVCDTIKPSGPHKISVMPARAGQALTAAAAAASTKVTGASDSASRAITGSQYALVVPQQPTPATRAGSLSRRGTPMQLMLSELASVDAGPLAPTGGRPSNVTGNRPGVGGGAVTGDERGACGAVTGTSYVGPDNLHAACEVGGENLWSATEPAAPSGFSIVPPSLQRQALGGAEVTGIRGTGSQCITGPGMKAQGLITGTPEFRHMPAAAVRRSGWEASVAVQAAAASSADPRTVAPQVTGQGAHDGRRVSGDAWSDTRRLTGTEGASATARNPSLKGAARGVPTGARAFKGLERPEVPPHVVTGSSGSTERGATITVSGGARG